MPFMTQTQESGLPEAQWLTVNEVAAYLRVHPMAVRRAIQRRELTSIRIGSAIRVDAASVRARYSPATTS